MRSVAVGICLDCPVRRQCLDEALRVGDSGVVRGAMLLVEVRRKRVALPLVCVGCNTEPVRITATGHSLYCGPDCAGRTRRSATVTSRRRRKRASIPADMPPETSPHC
jgi:Transcription factor WhiB